MIQWTENGQGASARLGLLGSLVVRKLNDSKRHIFTLPLYEVVVLGTALKKRSYTLDEGKERAVFAARRWLKEAASKLSLDDCPKRILIGGCDWPRCDCQE